LAKAPERATGKDVDLIERVCTAYAWQRALGHEATRDALCTVVRDTEHPELWAANHVSLVRAHDPSEIAEVLDRAERAFAHARHRLFVVDPLTPPEFVARLALDDYSELTPTIQLVLDGALRGEPRPLDIRPALDDEDWLVIEGLLAEDHGEGARSHGRTLPAEVTRAMVASFRKKAPACSFFVGRVGRVDCAYGAAVLCEDGVGMVEDLFTLAPYRRRGVATALIAHLVAHLRARGATAIAIGAHADREPKRLYAALGFSPVCLTREYLVHGPRA
jgi:GNAT superfamily N-acetyltransferase